MMQLQSFYNSECIIPTLTEYFNGETYLSVTHQSNNILFDSLLLRICHFSSLVCTSTSAELLERAKNWLASHFPAFESEAHQRLCGQLATGVN